MFRRASLALLAMLSIGLAAPAALAGDPPAPPVPTETTKVTWTLGSGKCKLLPKGLKLSGTGTSRKYTFSGMDVNGSPYFTEFVVIKGTATDNRGGRYRFDYHNSFTAPDADVPYTGIISDHFTLYGNGEADGLHSAFVTRLTVTSEDPFQGSFDPIYAVGDPFGFADFAPRCDPL